MTWKSETSIRSVTGALQALESPEEITLTIKSCIDFGMMKFVSMELLTNGGGKCMLNFDKLFNETNRSNSVTRSEAILEAKKNEKIVLFLPKKIPCEQVRLFHTGSATVSLTMKVKVH